MTISEVATVTMWRYEHTNQIIASCYVFRDRREYDLGSFPDISAALRAVGEWARGRHLVLEDTYKLKYNGEPIILRVYH